MAAPVSGQIVRLAEDWRALRRACSPMIPTILRTSETRPWSTSTSGLNTNSAAISTQALHTINVRWRSTRIALRAAPSDACHAARRGDLLSQRGQHSGEAQGSPEAVALYQRSLTIRQALADSDPQDVFARSRVAFRPPATGAAFLPAGHAAVARWSMLGGRSASLNPLERNRVNALQSRRGPLDGRGNQGRTRQDERRRAPPTSARSPFSRSLPSTISRRDRGRSTS